MDSPHKLIVECKLDFTPHIAVTTGPGWTKVIVTGRIAGPEFAPDIAPAGAAKPRCHPPLDRSRRATCCDTLPNTASIAGAASTASIAGAESIAASGFIEEVATYVSERLHRNSSPDFGDRSAPGKKKCRNFICSVYGVDSRELSDYQIKEICKLLSIWEGQIA